MAGSLRMREIAKVSNAEILNDTTTGGPALPTIGELNRPVASKAGWVWSGRRSLLFFPNGEFVAQVKLHRHLRPRLADPASIASDVYLVTRPATVGANPAGSLKHWSFYTQGIFYHLHAPELQRGPSGKSQNTMKSIHAGCKLRREGLSDVDSEDYVTLRDYPGLKLFVAYKVGQTDYRSDQILCLARWAVHQLSVYGFLSANCQHFATTMVRRTVMRVGDRSTFAGTAIQIIRWDLGMGERPHVNGTERGFLISPPLPVDLTISGSIVSTFCWWFKVRGYIRPGAVRILYEKGPDAIGAWHPSGYWKAQFREAGSLMYHSIDELKEADAIQEDIAQKRWKDALYGKHQILPDGTKKRPLQRRPKRNDFELTQHNVLP